MNVDKVIEASAILLQLHSRNRMNYHRLLRLLYIADRISIERCERPITGNRFVATIRGPFADDICDLIKGALPESLRWTEFIKRDHDDVELVNHPVMSMLSEFEIHLLLEINNEFKSKNDGAVDAYLHSFNEYVKHKPKPGGDSKNCILMEDLLDAVGHGDRKDAIIEAMKIEAAEDAVFSKHCQPSPPAARSVKPRTLRSFLSSRFRK